MSKFYLLLWLKWALRLSLSSILYGTIFSLIMTVVMYVKEGFVVLNSDVYMALFDIFKFWFIIFYNLALLLALFRGMKYIFNSCIGGHTLELYTCTNEKRSELIEYVGYGDLVKVWRKWFMLMIWIVGSQMVVAVMLSTIFMSSESIFEWFNIYMLYGFILVAGYFSFMILTTRCKQVKVSKC